MAGPRGHRQSLQQGQRGKGRSLPLTISSSHFDFLLRLSKQGVRLVLHPVKRRMQLTKGGSSAEPVLPVAASLGWKVCSGRSERAGKPRD